MVENIVIGMGATAEVTPYISAGEYLLFFIIVGVSIFAIYKTTKFIIHKINGKKEYSPYNPEIENIQEEKHES